MSPPFHKTEGAAKAIEALRLELERCRRELDECRKRMEELEHTEALLAGENRIIEQTTHVAAVAIERKRTETALQASEERFRRMADAIPEVIWFTALGPERVLYVSPSFERIWGLPVKNRLSFPIPATKSAPPGRGSRM